MSLVPRPHPEATMSFIEHLEELRIRILWSLGALVLGAGVGFWATTRFDVIGFLTRPVRPLLEDGRLTYLHPTEPFMVTIKVGIFVGAVLALPVVFYHFWRFVAPGLMENEKRIFVPALLSSVALFVGGAALAFFLVLPFGLRFFLGFGTESLQPMITINDYFSFAMQVTLMFGLVFETPLVILVLAWVGVLPTRTIRKYRRHAIAVMAIVSAVLTPADVVSMLLMLVPLYLLFEISVLMAGLIERRREGRSSEAGGALGERADA
jgi:sec-independent protein translocase protein TatC